MDEKISKLMKSLNISEQEAIELVEADKRIDRGEKLFELDPELAVGAKKARQADRKITERKPREKKVNADKKHLIAVLAKAVGNAEITNNEREFTFVYNDVRYKIVMSVPRC